MKPLGVFDVGSDIKSSGRTWPMANLEPVQTSQDYSFGLCATMCGFPFKWNLLKRLTLRAHLLGEM